MATKWQLYDIIDLEFFLATQEENNDHHKRDRQWFLDTFESSNHQTGVNETAILSKYISDKREGMVNPPGSLLKEFSVFLTVCVVLLALFTGTTVTAAALWYDGSVPVNIFRFLGIVLAPQLLFLVFMLFSFLLQRDAFFRQKPPLLIRFSQSVLLNLFFRLKKNSFSPPRGSQRIHPATTSIIANNSKIFILPVFKLFQIFALFFNFAALVTLLTRVATSDIAFGWQSTLNIGSEFLFNLIQTVSVPWHYFFPHSLPSLAEVEGSRIILKEGISVLSNDALSSWWPFLFFTLLVYGFMPRLLIFILAGIREKNVLAGFTNEQPEIRHLLQRMQTPYVSSAAKQPAETKRGLSSKAPANHVPLSGAASVFVLIPEDIHLSSEKQGSLIRRLGFTAEQTATIEMYWDSDIEILPESDSVEILLVLEAWMPPIIDTLRYIEKLSQNYTTIHIGLVGKPVDHETYTTPKKIDLNIWQTKIDSIQQNNLHIAPLPDMKG